MDGTFGLFSHDPDQYMGHAGQSPIFSFPTEA